MTKKTDVTDDGKEYNLPNGNYIRLILRTSEDGANGTANKDTILENVEDYLEIESSVTSTSTDENEDNEEENDDGSDTEKSENENEDP